MTDLRKSLAGYMAEAEGRIDLQDRRSASLAQCDLAYARHLLGQPAFESGEDLAAFTALLEGIGLAGCRDDRQDRLNVHMTAYALGTLNLAGQAFPDAVAGFVEARDWHWPELFDARTLVPKWPRKYAHHSWRVSHWIGGAPSILKSLWQTAPQMCRDRSLPEVGAVLTAADGLVDDRTGLLRTYRSDALQFAFRQLYRVRHDPDAGAVGGVVHLHWVNYAQRRLPYKGAAALFERARKLMRRTPFMERQPYCLDFDIVQIVRTSATDLSALDGAIRARAARYADDVVAFLATGLGDGYALHKLPGALATVHECALIRGEDEARGLKVKATDIIKDAFWL